MHLFPPSTAPLLYPEAVWGESANHSRVDFAKPDLVQHPLYAQALGHQRRIVVKVGVTDCACDLQHLSMLSSGPKWLSMQD